MKYLWLLINPEVSRLDEVSAFVISAENEEAARSIAAKNAQDEGVETWKDIKRSSCKKIGIALDEDVFVRVAAGF